MSKDDVLNKIARAANESLEELDLSWNDLTEIPEEILDLTNLKILQLENNKIQEIPSFLDRLNNLQEIQLHHNQIKDIPESITNIHNLYRLNLNNNQIRKIPESITNLTNLNYLNLSNNQIEEIPGKLVNLINLKALHLSNNQIQEIPDTFDNLINLEELYLSNNQIEKVPERITELTNLRVLALYDNQIQEIPRSISNLGNLTSLSFGNNKIQRISEGIISLINLKSLVLYGNKITEIPKGIAKLINLEVLVLYSNQIIEIPEEIGYLINLTELYLYDNKIQKTPESLARLANLKKLDLHKNQIVEMPRIIEGLTRLEKLNLQENLLSIPRRILDLQDAQKIFNYLRQLRTGVHPLHEAKLLLIGQGNVGKTSLILRLLHNRYEPNQPVTHGLKIETWEVQVNSKDVRLNVWDFGGQEIYHATHQFFLTKRSLYLLVCNCRTNEEENRIEYWLKLIESFGGQSPVIIVGNKKDEHPLDINRKSLREKFPNIQTIVETSCQSNEGIDELRTAILEQVNNLEEVYRLLPISWFEVKEQLESMPEDFISYNRYLSICHENKISEEQDQEQLIDLLHSLGLVLNFREHPILQNTNVLKPNWLTEGIYSILSDDIIKTKNKGIFTTIDLTRILDSVRYPSNRHNYLVELMKEFELCFALSDNQNKFLIPGLLPKDEPNDTKLEGETLEFQYHYRILPDSIISRFIVLTHDRIYKQIYWRSGVMLTYQENNETYNIACIKADREDKKIFITVNGRQETMRVFMCLIRDIFQKIHKSLPNLEITECVPIPNHPEHPPLDYQELLALKSMGETSVAIGKLRLKIDIEKLLDGYVSRDNSYSYKELMDVFERADTKVRSQKMKKSRS
jgi:internalin A